MIPKQGEKNINWLIYPPGSYSENLITGPASYVENETKGLFYGPQF
jgi:hypothetical protein